MDLNIDKTYIIGGGVLLGLAVLLFSRPTQSANTSTAALEYMAVQANAAPSLLAAYAGYEGVKNEAAQMRLAAVNSHLQDMFNFLATVDGNSILRNAQTLQFGAKVIDTNAANRAVGFAHDENMFGLDTERSNSAYGLESLRIDADNKHEENSFLNTSERLFQTGLTELSRLGLQHSYDLDNKEIEGKYTLANRTLDVERDLSTYAFDIQKLLGLGELDIQKTAVVGDLENQKLGLVYGFQNSIVQGLYNYNVRQREITSADKTASKQLAASVTQTVGSTVSSVFGR